jgi:hypothetical protein
MTPNDLVGDLVGSGLGLAESQFPPPLVANKGNILASLASMADAK